jgi:RNA polymerase sigma-70 factor (ECF subfamily)
VIPVGEDEVGSSNSAIGDEAAFADLTQRHRRELHVHCYRMLGSYDEAEDAVQETLLRAWRHRDTFDGTQPRAWLYRIATNVCLDTLRQRSRRATKAASLADLPWLQPYPDRLLDEVAPRGDEPDAVAVERETIELAFLAALQALPPRQRAALIARDVLAWTASDTASLLGMSVPAANSALQRARATMQTHLPARRSEWSAGPATATERDLLAQFIDAHERRDAAAAIAIAARDIRVTMPPYLMRFDGLDGLRPLLERALGPEREGEWQLVPTAVNRLPAAASYLLRPGDSVYRALKLDVLRIEGAKIAEITTFGSMHFPRLGLPETVDA